MATETRPSFTPGPWVSKPTDPKQLILNEVVGKDHTHVVFDGADERHWLAIVSRPFDARLIAAAPEMYEALQTLIGYFRGNNNAACADNSSGDYCLTHDAYKPCPWADARAALAKADGR